MSGLTIAPALHNPTGRNPNATPLLTDARPETQNKPAEQAHQAAPTYAAPPLGTYAHIQAQILGTVGQRSFRRPTVNSPREAARAYGQARRRPQTVSDMPSLKNVV